MDWKQIQDKWQHKWLEAGLGKATVKKNKEKFMIVEDGGYAFPILHDNPELYPFLKHCIGAVEHTARGMWNYQYLETDGVVKMPRILSRPALTVANSTIKAKHEPYFVAQAIIDEMAYLLRKKHDFIGYKNIAVLGAGRVGRGIASLLNKLRINLTVVDHNQNNLDILKSDNDRIKTETFLTSDTINNINIIIGATGNPSLDKNHLHTFIENKQPELILVSASSKEIEFKEIINSMEELINKKIPFSDIKDLYQDYIKENKESLWEDRDELENLIKKPRIIEEYQEKELRNNEQFKYRAIGLFHKIKELHDIAFSSANELLGANGNYNEDEKIYIQELNIFSLLRKVYLISIDRAEIRDFTFDFVKLLKKDFKINPLDPELRANIKLQFFHTPEQKELILSYIKQFGTSINALGQILSSSYFNRFYREPKQV